MKKADVQLGAVYLVKVAGNLVPVKIDRENDNGGWDGTSVKTGKAIRIKSPQRLRKCLDEPAAKPKRRIMIKAEYEAEGDEAAMDSKPTPGRDTGQYDAKGPKPDGKPMSLLDATAAVLASPKGVAMNYKDIVQTATDRGLWTPGAGKTPGNTLSAAMRREIKVKGDNSRFRLVERGKFALND